MWFLAVVLLLLLLLLLAMWFVYQSTGPRRLHVVWDLDQTLLCSITPLDDGIVAAQARRAAQPRRCCCSGGNQKEEEDYFDIIDDDYPYEEGRPNTRTFWRPGARTVLQLLKRCCTLHVHTAAQGTYTARILKEFHDPTLFHTVLHRDLIHGKNRKNRTAGKDLELIFHAKFYHNQRPDDDDDDPQAAVVVNSNQPLDTIPLSPPAFPAERCILLDDRVSNFAAQPLNGLHVKPYTQVHDAPSAVFGGCDGEMLRLLGIVLLCHLKPGDVRPVLRWFWSEPQKDWYPVFVNGTRGSGGGGTAKP